MNEAKRPKKRPPYSGVSPAMASKESTDAAPIVGENSRQDKRRKFDNLMTVRDLSRTDLVPLDVRRTMFAD